MGSGKPAEAMGGRALLRASLSVRQAGAGSVGSGLTPINEVSKNGSNGFPLQAANPARDQDV